MKKTLRLETDSEWYYLQDNKPKPLTTQIGLENNAKFIFEHPQCGFKLLPTWHTETPLPKIFPEYREITLQENKGEYSILYLEVLVYYSFKDIYFLLGDRLARSCHDYLSDGGRLKFETKNRKFLLDYFLEHKHTEKIYQVQLQITDLSGIAGGCSLQQTSKAYGVQMLAKDCMDNYKTCMNVPYTNPELHNDFIDYSQGDLILFDLKTAHHKKHNEIRQLLNIKPSEKVPLTKGSEVANTFLDFIKENYLLNETLIKDKLQYNDYNTLIANNGIEANLTWDTKTTKPFNAIVHGGRCKAEQPHKMLSKELILSMDLQGCYASALVDMEYPIGIPIWLGYDHKDTDYQNKFTLGDFLKKYKNELVPDLWHIVVSTSTPLSFNQNLIFSKEIKGKVGVDNDIDELDIEHDTSWIKGQFGVYTREITNGIITHHSLETLQKVCSNNEWSELKKKLVVISGVIYPWSYKCATFEEFIQKTQNSSSDSRIKTIEAKHGELNRLDDRTRWWFSFPIGDFVGPLLRERKICKAERNTHPKGSSKYVDLDSKQECLKLFINALYGVIASPYFAIGNTTVANNITDMARTGCWAMNVLSSAFTSITDGCELEINRMVHFKDNKLPSLNGVFKIQFGFDNTRTDRKLRSKYSRAPLGLDKVWSITYNEAQKEYSLYQDTACVEKQTNNESWYIIDKLYRQHIQQHFGDLLWAQRFAYEDKGLYEAIVINSQANYKLYSPNPSLTNSDKLIKARGHKNKENFHDMFNKALASELISTYEPVTVNKILKVKEVRKAYSQKGVPSSGSKNDQIIQNKLLAGDTVQEQKRTYLVSSSCFYYQTIKQRKYWEKLEERCLKTTNKQYKLDYLFRNQDGTIEYQECHQKLAELIFTGHKSDRSIKKLCNNFPDG